MITVGHSCKSRKTHSSSLGFLQIQFRLPLGFSPSFFAHAMHLTHPQHSPSAETHRRRPNIQNATPNPDKTLILLFRLRTTPKPLATLHRLPTSRTYPLIGGVVLGDIDIGRNHLHQPVKDCHQQPQPTTTHLSEKTPHRFSRLSSWQAQEFTARCNETQKKGKRKGEEVLTHGMRMNSVLEVGILSGAHGEVHSHHVHGGGARDPKSLLSLRGSRSKQKQRCWGEEDGNLRLGKAWALNPKP